METFLEKSAMAYQGKVNILHSSFDPVEIHVRGRRATSAAFCVITSLLTLDGVDYELASYMRLLTRLEKPSPASGTCSAWNRFTYAIVSSRPSRDRDQVHSS